MALSVSLVEAAVSRQAMLQTAFFSGSLWIVNMVCEDVCEDMWDN